MKPKIYINNASAQEIFETKYRKNELKNRILSHTGSIHTSEASLLISVLRKMAMGSDDPIYLCLYNTSCSFANGLALYDTIQMLSCEVYTVGYGILDCVSSLIIASGTKGKRYLAPHTECMLSCPNDSPTMLMSAYHFCKEHKNDHMEQLASMLSACTYKSADEMQFYMEHGKMLTSASALHYGIVDHIGDPLLSSDNDAIPKHESLSHVRNLGTLSSSFDIRDKSKHNKRLYDEYRTITNRILDSSNNDDSNESID